MQFMVHDPRHPKDRSKAKALSPEQFAVVHDYIVDCMNSRRKKIDENVIRMSLDQAGMPLFNVDVQAVK